MCKCTCNLYVRENRPIYIVDEKCHTSSDDDVTRNWTLIFQKYYETTTEFIPKL